MEDKSLLSRYGKDVIIYLYGIFSIFYFLGIFASGEMSYYFNIPFQFYELLYIINIIFGLLFLIFAFFLSIRSVMRPISLMIAALIAGLYIVHEIDRKGTVYVVNMIKFPLVRAICNLNRCKNDNPDMTIIAATSWDGCESLIVFGDTATIINTFNGYAIREIAHRYQSLYKRSF